MAAKKLPGRPVKHACGLFYGFPAPVAIEDLKLPPAASERAYSAFVMGA